MRRKLTTITVAGALVLGGGALGGAVLAGPALAETVTETTADASDAVSARVERITEALGGLVSDGTLTQEQADEVASALADELPGRGGHGGGPDGGWRGGGLLMGLDTAADVLSLTPEELREALAADAATLASVAADQGVPTDDLVAALVDAAQTHLDEEVADGDLTQEEADERAADLEDRVSDLVSSELPARGERGPGGHGGHGARPGATDDGSTSDGSADDGSADDGSADDGSTGATTPEGGTTATPSSWSYAA